MFALLARHHMHLYGTTREHFAEIAIGTRAYALRHPNALMKVPWPAEAYFAAPTIAAPHCLFDFCLETDGAIAVVVPTAELAAGSSRPRVPHRGNTNGNG